MESQFPSLSFLTSVSEALVSFAWTAPPKPLSLLFGSFTVFSCFVTGMKKTQLTGIIAMCEVGACLRVLEVPLKGREGRKKQKQNVDL